MNINNDYVINCGAKFMNNIKQKIIRIQLKFDLRLVEPALTSSCEKKCHEISHLCKISYDKCEHEVEMSCGRARCMSEKVKH